MARYLVFVALGLLRVISASSEESDVGVKGFVARLKLMALTLTEFSTLHDNILEKGPKIFEEALKDPNVADVKTGDMESQTKLLQDYLDKLENAKKEKKMTAHEFIGEYTELIAKFDSNQNKLTPEATIVEKSLHDHGLGDLAQSIQTHFENFMNKFNAEIEPYINGLDEKEKKDEKEIIDWYEKVKAEEDMPKKIELFGEVLKFD